MQREGNVSSKSCSFVSAGTGAITRRSFLSTAAAAGLSAAAVSLLPGRAAAEPRKGGHFKLGIGSGATTDSLDPGTYADNYMQSVGHSLHGFLTEVTNTGDLAAELAESWEPSDDAKVWVFRLRKGVEFHNGKELRAEDVVASINYHRGEKSTSAAKSIVDPIVDIRADDQHTVVMTLEGGNADFPFLLSDYHLPIMPSKDGSVDPTSGVGCGAYVLETFQPGVRTLVKKNPTYWRSDRGWFESVEFLAIADVAARTTALMTGQIHAMNRCDLKTIDLLERSPNHRIYSVNGGQHYSMPMNTTVAPFDNNDVRLALKLAIDREMLLKTVLRGYGALGNDNPISPGYRYFDAELEQRVYDPERAKFHLKKAGMEGLKVNLSAANTAFAGAVDAAILYKENAARAGIDINVVREPDDGYWENVWMKKPWCVSYWGGKPTADWALTLPYAAGGSWNETFWNNERFNALLVAARAELDEAKRREMYAEMQRLLRDDGGAVIPVFANYVGAMSSKIGHDAIASNWDLDGLRAAERWWFEEA